MTTLAARALRLLNTDAPRRTDPHIAHVPLPIDVELAAWKLCAAATRQGVLLNITQAAGATTVRVTPAG